MTGSRSRGFQWIFPLIYVFTSIFWFFLDCHAQGGLEEPTNGIVLNLTTYNMTLNAGQTLYINASYKSTPSAHYAIWLKDNRPLFEFNMSSSIVGRFVPCPPVIIRNSKCSDAGLYTLFVNNSLGHHYSLPVTVYIVIPYNYPVSDPGNPYCRHAPICMSTGPSSSVLIREGLRVTLGINITTNPGLSFADWFFNSELVNRSDPRYENGDEDNPSLLITNVMRTDAGVYQLYANNSIGPLRSTSIQSEPQVCIYNLTVGYPPEFDCGCNRTDCHVVNETESCYFPVSVVAYPELSGLQWFKSNTRISNSTGRIRGGNLFTPSLTVTNTTREDSGQYRVTASNQFGTTQGCDCCCTVQFRPTCVLNYPLSPFSVTEGRNFVINVTLTALPPPNFVEWTLNNVAINRTSSRYIGGNTTTASLTVQQIHRNDAGLYVLIANNTVGNAGDTDCRVNVTVNYIPACTLLSNSNLIVSEFSTFTINVTLNSVPPAHTVVWSQNDIPVNRAGGRFVNGNSHSVPSLTIRNVTRQETGIYVLNATNIVGSITDRGRCRVNVTILYSPDITCPRNYTVCEDAPVTMECTVDALPPINSIMWRKDGLPLNFTSPRYRGGNVTVPSLTITSVLPEDNGLYECIVGNSVGTASCPVALEILSKPAVSVPNTAIVLLEGQTSSLGCSVDMRTNPTPIVVQWSKNGALLNTSSGRYSNGNTYVPSLTITNIQRDDAGVYSCGAINAVGDRQGRNIIVTVEYPPTVTVTYNNYGFPVHTNATLWCTVDSNPPVPPENITWVRDGLFTLPSASCNDIRPNLRVCNVATATAGVYRCRASNRLASRSSRDIQVNVRDDCHIRIQSVRLMNGTTESRSYGRLEVLIGRQWGTVCGRYWTLQATTVVCGSLGHSTGSSGLYRGGTGPIHIGHVRCEQGASTLGECGFTSISSCTHEQDIWLQCGSSPTTTTQTTTVTETTTADNTTVCPAVVAAADCSPLPAAVLGALLGLSLIINFCLYCNACCCCCSCIVKWRLWCRKIHSCNCCDGKGVSVTCERGEADNGQEDSSSTSCTWWSCCADGTEEPETASEASESPSEPKSRCKRRRIRERGQAIQIGALERKEEEIHRQNDVDNRYSPIKKRREEIHASERNRREKDRENEVRKMRRKEKPPPVETPPGSGGPNSYRDTMPLISTPESTTPAHYPGPENSGMLSSRMENTFDEDINRVINGLGGKEKANDRIADEKNGNSSDTGGRTVRPGRSGRKEGDGDHYRKKKGSESEQDQEKGEKRRNSGGRGNQDSESREVRKRRSKSEGRSLKYEDHYEYDHTYYNEISYSSSDSVVRDPRFYRSMEDYDA